MTEEHTKRRIGIEILLEPLLIGRYEQERAITGVNSIYEHIRQLFTGPTTVYKPKNVKAPRVNEYEYGEHTRALLARLRTDIIRSSDFAALECIIFDILTEELGLPFIAAYKSNENSFYEVEPENAAVIIISILADA